MAEEEGKVETVTDFLFLSSKITMDGDCSHKIKRHLPLVGKNKKSYDKPRQHIKKLRYHLPTKVHPVKAMVFPVGMHGCES